MNASDLKVTKPATRQDYAKRISYLYSKSVESIVNVGSELIQAKAALPHGDFTKLIRRDLPFKERTGQMFMEIARHPVISKPQNYAFLPATWTTLHALAGHDAEQVQCWIDAGKVHPEITGASVALLADLSGFEQLRQRQENRPQQSKPKLEAVQETYTGKWPGDDVEKPKPRGVVTLDGSCKVVPETKTAPAAIQEPSHADITGIYDAYDKLSEQGKRDLVAYIKEQNPELIAEVAA